MKSQPCSGKGTCGGAGTNFKCTCDVGYTGPACQHMACPSGVAWFDEATAAGGGHRASATCSNRGLCNTATGVCGCDDDYSLMGGLACQRFNCAVNNSQTCGGFGTCRTMNQLAKLGRTNGVFRKNVTYTGWDAAKIRTCHCKAADSVPDRQPGLPFTDTDNLRGVYKEARTDFAGYTCGQMLCPTGDNVMTDGDNEVQTVACAASAGWFTLQFRGQRTTKLQWTATAAEVEAALELLSTVHDVEVTYADAVSDSACLGAGHSFAVEFVSERGDLPRLRLGGTAATSMSVSEVHGTTEDVECSQHGICNRDIGQCRCFHGFGSSDGKSKAGTVAGPGDRGDCGYRYTTTKSYNEWEYNAEQIAAEFNN